MAIMIVQFSTIASIAPVRRECHYLPQQETIAVLAQLVERVIRNSSLLSSNHDKVWGSIPQVGSRLTLFFFTIELSNYSVKPFQFVLSFNFPGQIISISNRGLIGA